MSGHPGLSDPAKFLAEIRKRDEELEELRAIKHRLLDELQIIKEAAGMAAGTGAIPGLKKQQREIEYYLGRRDRP